MQTIEQKIVEVREWIESNRRGDNAKPIFWTLHYDTSIQKISEKSPKINKNFDLDGDESVEMLAQAIRRAANQPYKILMVSLRQAQTDSNPISFPFENPNYQHQQAGMYGIGGMPQNGNGFGMQDMIALMSGMFQNQIGAITQMSDLQRRNEIAELKNEIKLRELEKELEAERNSKKAGFFEKIAEVLPWESIIDRVFGVEYEAEQTTDNTPIPQTDDERKRLNEQVANDLRRIASVFKDMPQFIHELANFLETNPQNAVMYRKMMNGKTT